MEAVSFRTGATCPQCHGTGKHYQPVAVDPARPLWLAPCPTCSGTGKVRA